MFRENVPFLVTREPFTLFQRELQAAGGKQSILVSPGAVPAGHPMPANPGAAQNFSFSPVSPQVEARFSG